jgi:hypothetical protein
MMRRCGGLAVLLGLAAMLAGCVYDPYTGGYYPCCAYPYQSYASPYYRYPGYGGYQAQPGYPAQPGYQAQPSYQAQPGYSQPPPQ